MVSRSSIRSAFDGRLYWLVGDGVLARWRQLACDIPATRRRGNVPGFFLVRIVRVGMNYQFH
jgi:hypothetical protein